MYSKIVAPFRKIVTGYLKLVLSFYQVGSSFGKTFRVEWPDNLQSVFSSVAVFNFDIISLPGPACIVAGLRPVLVPFRSFRFGFLPTKPNDTPFRRKGLQNRHFLPSHRI